MYSIYVHQKHLKITVCDVCMQKTQWYSKLIKGLKCQNESMYICLAYIKCQKAILLLISPRSSRNDGDRWHQEMAIKGSGKEDPQSDGGIIY